MHNCPEFLFFFLHADSIAWSSIHIQIIDQTYDRVALAPVSFHMNADSDFFNKPSIKFGNSEGKPFPSPFLKRPLFSMVDVLCMSFLRINTHQNLISVLRKHGTYMNRLPRVCHRRKGRIITAVVKVFRSIIGLFIHIQILPALHDISGHL